MKRIAIIAGLPGSGKSSWIGQYIREQGGFWYVIDDYNPDMLAFTKERIHADSNVIIASIDFCRSGHIDRVVSELEKEFRDLKVDIIYFENRPDKCIENILQRARERGDHFQVTNIGSTILIGDINPLTGEAGIESDIRAVFELWRDYNIDVTKTVVPVYSKEC